MSKLRLVVMASGSGTTFEALAKANSVDFEVIGLIASKPNIDVIERAQKLNIPFQIATSDEDTLMHLKEWNPNLVVLAGYLKKVGPQTLAAYENKMLNTHPSLLPKYGGPGMFGRRVHEAVIANAEEKSGVTIHWVTENYDEGPIIAQKEVILDSNETVESLEIKVKDTEKIFLIETLNSLPKLVN